MELIWTKTSERLPESRQEVMFVVSPHYGGPNLHLGKFVAHVENQYGINKNIFFGNHDSLWTLKEISHWAEKPILPTE